MRSRGARLFSMCVSRVWGHAPLGIFLHFGLPEIASGALSDTTFWMLLVHVLVIIYVKGGLKRKLNCPPTFLNAWPGFQSSNLIGQSNVITNVQPSDIFALVLALIERYTCRTRDMSDRWCLTILLLSTLRGVVGVQELASCSQTFYIKIICNALCMCLALSHVVRLRT